MTTAKVIRWWPPIGLSGMVLLGLVVGTRSTALDDWFLGLGRAARNSARMLLHFTDPRLLALGLLGAFAVALYRRRWRLAVAMVATPAVGLVAVRVCKILFGREKQGALAYPSGHVTVMVIVLGMIVLVAGTRLWQVAVATVFALLGVLGQATTYHYFTDTIGAVLLATSLVCLAARAAKLDRCQPSCDLHHSAS